MWSRFGLDPITVARVACAQSSFFRWEWIRAFPGVSLRGLPRVYVQFHILCREISVRTSHGSPKLCGCRVQRRVADITTNVWVRSAPCGHAYGECIMCCVSRACRPCSVPGFPARDLYLEHDTFSQAGKTSSSAHQAHNDNQPVTSSTRPTHTD